VSDRETCDERRDRAKHRCSHLPIPLDTVYVVGLNAGRRPRRHGRNSTCARSPSTIFSESTRGAPRSSKLFYVNSFVVSNAASLEQTRPVISFSLEKRRCRPALRGEDSDAPFIDRSRRRGRRGRRVLAHGGGGTRARARH